MFVCVYDVCVYMMKIYETVTYVTYDDRGCSLTEVGWILDPFIQYCDCIKFSNLFPTWYSILFEWVSVLWRDIVPSDEIFHHFL